MPLVMSVRAQPAPAACWFFQLACPVLLAISGSTGHPAIALSAEQPPTENLESPGDLGQLIQQLDADQYETRHQAEQQLAAAGAVALEAVSRVAAEARHIAGVAWAPGRGISRVEVNVDDSGWQVAELSEPLSNDSWRQWSINWDAQPGTHRLQVRATDGNGETQTSESRPPRPDGATSYHTISVVVE